MNIFDDLVGQAFDPAPSNPLHQTLALVVAIDGEVVAERYAPEISADTTLISWSMAKSMVSDLAGIAIDRGLLSLDEPAPVRSWQHRGDPRQQITLRHLLEMRSGLAWREEYVDGDASDVIDMLFGDGANDVAGWAEKQSLAHEPGTHWVYSSGTSNIISRLCSEALGGPEVVEREFRRGVLEPAGMRDLTLRRDASGTWVASSFAYATARDYLAYGELHRSGGRLGSQQLLPAGWVETATAEQAVDPASGQGYGMHWWAVRDEPGSYAASGYEGQRIQVTPAYGLTFVRLGRTPEDRVDDLRRFYSSIVQAASSA